MRIWNGQCMDLQLAYLRALKSRAFGNGNRGHYEGVFFLLRESLESLNSGLPEELQSHIAARPTPPAPTNTSPQT